MIEIDGSQGEGGGQVLRTSLSLSMVTGKAFRIKGIRAGRTKPGLLAQHLQAVLASSEICNADVTGAEFGSTELTFKPHAVNPGNYHFKIGTAGSTSLVLQTVMLPLCRANAASTVTISGGTHVAWSPPYQYLEWQWLNYLRQCGIKAKLTLEQAGFYPQGNGLIRAEIQAADSIQPLIAIKRGNLVNIRGISAVANLDDMIARRQKHQALRRLEPICRDTKIDIVSLPSRDRGTAVVLLAEFENSRACFSALGELGKRAEQVADEAVDNLLAFFATNASIDPYLADQLLLPLALAAGPSELFTSAVTQHLLTNAAVIEAFLPLNIGIEGELGQPGRVIIAS